MDDRAWRVSKDVDRPLPFLMWEMQDLAVGMGAVTLGIVLHQFILGLVVFICWLVFAKKAAAGAKRGQMTHVTWRAGIVVDAAMKKHAPHPGRNEYLE